MRPLQLTLTNFGPYANETIDFEALATTPLFLITGKTGSGKTTIFDGLTYALYGKGTSDREPESMRADFAAATVPTKVCLKFEHQGKRYEITRQPKQILQKKRGTGTKEMPADVSLAIFEAGIQIEALSKARDINPRIEAILQLSRAQFVQIILLPQGDFREFLISSSADKETILRKIFNTQLYQRWGERLVAQLKDQEAQTKDQQTAIDMSLKQVDWVTAPEELTQVQQIEALKKQQTETSKTLENQNQQIETQQDQLDQRKSALEAAKTLDQQLQTIQAIKVQQAENDRQLPQIKQVQQQLTDLRWAQALAPDYQQYLDAQQEATGLAAQIKTTQHQATTLTETIQQQQQAVDKFTEQRPVQQQRQAQLTLEQAQQSKYEAVEKIQQQLAVVNQQLAQKQANFEKNQRQIQRDTEESETLTSKITQIPELKIRLNELNYQQEKIQNWQEICADLKTQQQSKKAMGQQIQADTTELTDLEVNVQAAENNKNDLYNQRLANHIAELAQQLKPGTPCPICGSVTHPHPNLPKVAAVTEAQVQAAEKHYEQLQSKLAQAQADLKRQQKQYDDACANFTDTLQTLLKTLSLTQETMTLAEITEVVAQQALAVTQTQKTTQSSLDQAQQAKIQQITLQEKLQSLDQTKASLQHDRDEARTTAQNLTTKLDTWTEGLPKDFKDLAALQSHLQQLTQAIQVFEHDEKRASDDLGASQNQLTKAQTMLDRFSEQNDQLQQKLQKSQTDLQTELTEHLDSVDWSKFKALLQQQDQINPQQAKVTAYQDQQTKLAAALAANLKLVGDRTAVETTTIEATIETQKAQLATLKAEQQATNKRYVVNQSQLENIQKNLVKIGEQAQGLHELQQLVEIVRGGRETKLGLERYVLRAYLLEILTVANSHLDQLSSGRYAMMIHDEPGSYAKSTGLEIDVYDDNVGKARSVHTLSGGESFIAALSLALALGEVIQNQAGGITIDALFIDEGFGSLDQDALQTAMTALRNLEGQHRMIGIISHVTELKKEVPCQIQVQSDGHGQSKTKLVVDA